MTVPITLGVPQIILLVIAVIGLGMLITSLMSAVRTRPEKYIDESGSYAYRRRPHVKIFRGIGGILLIALSLSLLWTVFLVQTYLCLTSDIPAARIHANQIEGLPHQMSVEVTLYDKNGSQTSDKTYLVKGDRWQLQGNILKFPTWMNILGIHSGYKVTRLEGQYDDPNMEDSQPHTTYALNGGDGDFFKTVYKQAWSSPFVDAAYGNAVIVPADGHTYNVLISQTGLYAKPAK